MYDDTPIQPKPPMLKEIMADNSWSFPTDYPIVNNANSPDADRTLKAVIEYSISEYFADHRINSFVIADFDRHFKNRLYNKMSQHQYWIDQYIQLIKDGQFFYNEEWQDGGNHTVESNDRTTSSTNSNLTKSSDTPQNTIGDINNYLTQAQQDNGSDSGSETMTHNNDFTTDLHIKKSTLGDITVQFRNFANFPNFINEIIVAVTPCFINYYGDEDIDYGTTV